MYPNSDLIDLLRALNEEHAEYLLVGGYAFAMHGRVRATKDADLFVGTDPENAVRVWRARPPNQIDVITEIDGIHFDRAWQNRVEASYGGVKVWYISRNDLIINKEAADRPQDRLDVAFLRERQEPD